MKKLFKELVFFFYSIYLFPIWVVWKIQCLSQNKEALKYISDTMYFHSSFFRILFERPEYICVLYMRLGFVGKLFRIYKKNYPCYMPESSTIGEIV